MTTKNSMMTKSSMITKTRGAVLYTRVSGDEQDRRGTSPETQRDACRLKAQEMGLPVVAEYYDGGISGGLLLARAGFQAALADIQAGRADTLICPNISRYSRDVEHQQAVKKAVRAAGGQLVFCDMEFADTPEGDLNFTIQGGFAEYERKLIRQRTMKGKRKRAEEGRQMSPSRPPLGYHVVLKADVLRGTYPPEMLGRYVVEEAQAPVIRELFARYASGECGTPKIAQDFNQRALPLPRGGTLWRCSTLRCLLRNPVYKGEPAYGRFAYRTDESRLLETNKLTGLPRVDISVGVPAPDGYTVALTAPPLVTQAVWDAAQERMTANRGQMSGNPRRARMLSGRVYCPCGHKATFRGAGSTKSLRPGPENYQCSKARNAQMWLGKEGSAADALPSPKALPCSLELFRVSAAEAATVRAFLSAASAPPALADARRAKKEQREQEAQSQKRQTPRSDPRAEMAALDRALEMMRDEEDGTITAQMAGMRAGASPDAYASRFADIAARRKDAEDRRGQLSRQLAAPLRFGAGSGANSTAKSSSKPKAAEPAAINAQALADAALVLSSPDVPGETKRSIIALVIEKVVCQKSGADVYFLPGFGLGAGFGPDGLETLHSEQVLEWLGDSSR